jgi:lipopolysaccharide/colanic/teichoic acid biosynthesis glycosyltransferase
MSVSPVSQNPPVETVRRAFDWYSISKRTVDLVLGTIALVLALPSVLVAAVAIAIEGGGPVFFRQQRVGMGGRTFTMWKLRTMVVGNDDKVHREYIRAMLSGEGSLETAASGFHKLDDLRVTSVGRILRRTSIDELPQLLNVLRGDMSLVGPRPCLPWEVELYAPVDQVRFDVKPGMTGLWQVSGRSRLPMTRALELDRAYALHRSLLTDLKILLKTIPAVLERDAA